MKKLITLLWILLLLTSCFNQQESEKKSDIFERKQNCAEYKDLMLEDWTNKNLDWMNSTWDAYKLDIEEIFYNDENETCIYVLTIDKFIDLVVNGKYTDYIRLNRYAYDFLSKKELFSTTDLNDEEFNTKIEELKK